jgi:plasmid stabilization system protein ParE
MGWACKIGHPQFESTRTFLVSSRFDEYLIFYRPYEDRIEIMRVVNGTQDLKALFSKEGSLDPEPDAG